MSGPPSLHGHVKGIRSWLQANLMNLQSSSCVNISSALQKNSMCWSVSIKPTWYMVCACGERAGCSLLLPSETFPTYTSKAWKGRADTFGHRSCSSAHLEELQVDVGKPTGPQLHLQRSQRGQELQGDDGAQASAHRSHALRCLQLPHPKAPDRCRVHVLVLPPARAGIQAGKGERLGALLPCPTLLQTEALWGVCACE